MNGDETITPGYSWVEVLDMSDAPRSSLPVHYSLFTAFLPLLLPFLLPLLLPLLLPFGSPKSIRVLGNREIRQPAG